MPRSNLNLTAVAKQRLEGVGGLLHRKGGIFDRAVNPVSEDVKKYTVDVVRSDMPDKVEEILNRILETDDIDEIAREFVEVWKEYRGLGISISMDQITGLIESIIPIQEHFDEVSIDTNYLYDIVHKHIWEIIEKENRK